MVLVTGQFEKLAAAILVSKGVENGVAIVIEENPEYVPDDRLAEIAEQVLAQASARLSAER